jgi:hypothetical protein
MSRLNICQPKVGFKSCGFSGQSLAKPYFFSGSFLKLRFLNKAAIKTAGFNWAF